MHCGITGIWSVPHFPLVRRRKIILWAVTIPTILHNLNLECWLHPRFSAVELRETKEDNAGYATFVTIHRVLSYWSALGIDKRWGHVVWYARNRLVPTWG
jgi:hypothetical protein